MNIDIDKTWLAIGLIGQALFSARFIVQWLQSERVKKSVIPSAFWYFSMAGGATLLASPYPFGAEGTTAWLRAAAARIG